MKFLLGTHKPRWLSRLDVPLFVSRRTLAEVRSLPRARAGWALDSGGFSELNLFGEWRTPAQQYAAEVRRWGEEIGSLEWAASQDWMCEPFMLRKTGLSLEEHQRRTVEGYERLRELAPDLPWAPVLQGWALGDYLRCADEYERRGHRLDRLPVVGLGSVCRRQATAEARVIVGRLAARGYRLHGFGFKTLALGRVGTHLASSDSLAWSYHARRRPPPRRAPTPELCELRRVRPALARQGPRGGEGRHRARPTLRSIYPTARGERMSGRSKEILEQPAERDPHG
jgi:hypothetical protein